MVYIYLCFGKLGMMFFILDADLLVAVLLHSTIQSGRFTRFIMIFLDDSARWLSLFLTALLDLFVSLFSIYRLYFRFSL